MPQTITDLHDLSHIVVAAATDDPRQSRDSAGLRPGRPDPRYGLARFRLTSTDFSLRYALWGNQGAVIRWRYPGNDRL